jgi:hypothetical protein
MGSKPIGYDDQAAAKLVLQLKAIATKEVEKIPQNCIDALFQLESMKSSISANARRRTVSVGSVDMVYSSAGTPVLSCNHRTLVVSKSFSLDDEGSNASSVDHHDWSGRVLVSPTAVKKVSSSLGAIEHPLLCSPNDIIKHCKKKRESFVGLLTKTGSVRATLQKKVGDAIFVTHQHQSTIPQALYLHHFAPLYRTLHSSLGSRSQR